MQIEDTHMRARSDPAVDALLRAGAWAVFSVSGGKDSTAAMHAAIRHLDAIGHPRDRRLALHADLGRAEWRSTHAHVERVCALLDVPLEIVRHSTHDMVSRWQRRGEMAISRYIGYDTTKMFAPWSSSSGLFCRSELKLTPLFNRKAKLAGDVVSIVGLRRAESTGRRNTPIFRVEDDLSRRVGGTAMLWHPIAEWPTQDVYDYHAEWNLPLHEAYGLGSTRLSCAYCVLGSMNDLTVSSGFLSNQDLYRMLVSMEADSAFSFQPSRWLADVAPHLLDEGMRQAIADAKKKATTRRAIEAAIPPSMIFKQNVVPPMPTMEQAETMAGIRRAVSALHDLESLYLDAASIIEKHRLLAKPKTPVKTPKRPRGVDIFA